MSKWDGLNRRKFPRVKYPCLVIVRSGAQKAPEAMLTHTENVGIGGVCVTLRKNIKNFSPVEVEVDLLDLSNHIKCQGKVVWNVQRKSDTENKPLYYDIGIEFADLEDSERQRLEKIVDRLVKSNQDVV